MSLRVYVAAPYADAPAVREFHLQLRGAGIAAVSAWADFAAGPEKLDALSVEAVRAVARANDEALFSSHVVVAFAREAAGGEMFAEVRLALEYGIPVVWVGERRSLSAFRAGVMRLERREDALEHVRDLGDVVRRPWPVDDEWVRDTLWDLMEGTREVKEADHAA